YTYIYIYIYIYTYFREGLSLTEYIISCYGARKIYIYTYIYIYIYICGQIILIQFINSTQRFNIWVHLFNLFKKLNSNKLIYYIMS
ncbi:MAG: hypothetical protein N7Q72_02530, partial [Spiroplasma sp. Tabriz.8]|nr:hypothetical protein [Spiroplasma sp. Tabriz.8]